MDMMRPFFRNTVVKDCRGPWERTEAKVEAGGVLIEKF